VGGGGGIFWGGVGKSGALYVQAGSELAGWLAGWLDGWIKMQVRVSNQPAAP